MELHSIAGNLESEGDVLTCTRDDTVMRTTNFEKAVYHYMSPVLLPQYKAMTFLILKQRDSRHGRTNEITETRRSVSCWLHVFDRQLDLRVNFTYN